MPPPGRHDEPPPWPSDENHDSSGTVSLGGFDGDHGAGRWRSCYASRKSHRNEVKFRLARGRKRAMSCGFSLSTRLVQGALPRNSWPRNPRRGTDSFPNFLSWRPSTPASNPCLPPVARPARSGRGHPPPAQEKTPLPFVARALVWIPRGSLAGIHSGPLNCDSSAAQSARSTMSLPTSTLAQAQQKSAVTSVPKHARNRCMSARS